MEITGSLSLDVNISINFAELMMFLCPTAANAGGINPIENSCHLGEPISRVEVGSLLDSAGEEGYRQTALNSVAVDMAAVDYGFLSEYSGKYLGNVDVAMDATRRRRGCRHLNALLSNRDERVLPEEPYAVATAKLHLKWPLKRIFIKNYSSNNLSILKSVCIACQRLALSFESFKGEPRLYRG